MRRRGADYPVVVLKLGNAHGAKGVGDRGLFWVNRWVFCGVCCWENLIIQRERGSSLASARAV
jgi:hypothetical protein